MFLYGVRSFTPPDEFTILLEMRRRVIPCPVRMVEPNQSIKSRSPAHGLQCNQLGPWVRACPLK